VSVFWKGKPSGRIRGVLVRKKLVCQYFKDVSNLNGDVIEAGVAFGYTLFPVAEMTSKTVYACDTFDGLPYDDSIVSPQMCRKGQWREGVTEWGVAGNYRELFLKELPKHKNVVMVKGLVEETLHTLSDKKFCFAWLDMDLYQPTSFAAKWLEDRLVVGGILGFHDYGNAQCPGINKVADEELARDRFAILHTSNACIFFRKIK
jgi:hypothetical protein